MIVVDYHTLKKTVEYIKHVRSMIEGIDILHAVIVDNYPEDSLSILKEFYTEKCTVQVEDKKIVLFDSPEGEVAYFHSTLNLGYAKGNNFGAHVVDFLYKDSFYIFSNNDLIISEKISWDVLYGIYASDKNICIVGPKIVGLDGIPQSPNRRMKPIRDFVGQYWLLKPFHWKGDLDYTSCSKYCYRVSGCFMVARSSLFNSVGGFDSNTFMYCEEMILSERLKQINAKVYFWNDCVLVHNHGATVKKYASQKQVREWYYNSYYYFFKNYMHSNRIIMALGAVSFRVFCFRTFVRRKIKRILRIEKD